MFIIISKAFQYLVRIPVFTYYLVTDYIKLKIQKYFDYFHFWGLHIYVAKFGGGKTSSMVQRAYKLAKAYPEMTIITNITLQNFPKHTVIKQLKTIDDIINAPNQTLIVIDEIGTIFNSRDFQNGKTMPKMLFQYICQVRHREIMILGTAQRWHFLDKQLRDICDTVNVCRSHSKHPLTRITTIMQYDALEYDLAYTNAMITCPPTGVQVRLQTDKSRALYDTKEMVQTALKAEYDDELTIMQRQGITEVAVGTPLTRKESRQVGKSRKAF